MTGGLLLASVAVNAQSGDGSGDIHVHIASKPTYAQIFKENIRVAVANHPRIASAIAARDSLKYQQKEAEAALYPQLDVGLSGRHRMLESFEDRFDNITERSRRKTSANASITGSQLLYDGGETFSRINSARHAFGAAHGEYTLETSSVALIAIEAHYQVLYHRQRVRLHQQNVDRHLNILQKVKLRYTSGRGSNRDVALMEARLASAEADAIGARKDMETSTSQYEEIYGFFPENLQRPEFSLNIPDSEVKALQQGLLNNPALSVATSRTMAAKETMMAEKQTRLPRLSMELAATKYDLERGNNDYDVTGRLVMNYNLYSGGARSARISRSLKNYERSRHDEANVQREITRAIKIAYQNMLTQKRRVSALKKARDAHKRNRDQFQEQFEATGGNLLSLLEAERDYHLSREKYLGSIIENDIFNYRALDAMGMLLPILNIRLKKGAL